MQLHKRKSDIRSSHRITIAYEEFIYIFFLYETNSNFFFLHRVPVLVHKTNSISAIHTILVVSHEMKRSVVRLPNIEYNNNAWQCFLFKCMHIFFVLLWKCDFMHCAPNVQIVLQKKDSAFVILRLTVNRWERDLCYVFICNRKVQSIHYAQSLTQ